MALTDRYGETERQSHETVRRVMLKADGTFNSCPLFPHHRPLLIRKNVFLLQINCTNTERRVIEATLLQTLLPYADKTAVICCKFANDVSRVSGACVYKQDAL